LIAGYEGSKKVKNKEREPASYKSTHHDAKRLCSFRFSSERGDARRRFEIQNRRVEVEGFRPRPLWSERLRSVEAGGSLSSQRLVIEGVIQR
jgi:hypothetical protein